MSNTLDVALSNRRLRFHADLTVDALDAQDHVIKSGTWESFSGENENELSFKFEDEPRTSLGAQYSFSEDNQLVTRIPEQPGVEADSSEWILPGQIFIDDNRDLVYLLLDEAGTISTRKMFVYGQLDFLEGSDRLSVTFADGRQTAILGNNGVNSLRAEDFVQGGDWARDLLKFDAVTINEVNGTERATPAIIQFVGRWDLFEGRLALVTEFEISSGKPKGFIAIGGSYKGTNVGLLVEEDGKFALQVEGTYSWNRSALTWGLRLGHTPGNTLEGNLSVAGDIKGKNGTLNIKGDLNLKGRSGALKIDFDLEIRYGAKDQSLCFKVSGAGHEYQINFGGTINVQGGKVTFSIEASSGGKIQAEFGFYKKDPNLEIALTTILSRKGFELSSKIKFRVAWGPGGLLEVEKN